MDALRQHRAPQYEERLRLGEAYADYGLVFATSLGTGIGERNVIRSSKRALGRAGLRLDIPSHGLRHALLTTAAHLGGDVKSLSARVGHASVAFTLDRYAHALEHADRDLALTVEGPSVPLATPCDRACRSALVTDRLHWSHIGHEMELAAPSDCAAEGATIWSSRWARQGSNLRP